MADENPHQFSTQTTGVTFAQITDNTDFPHTGLIKALSLMARGNMAVKGSATDFDITQAGSGNVIQVAAGRIFKDNKLTAQVVAKNFTSSAFNTTANGNNLYHLLVVQSSDNTLQIRKLSDATIADKVPEYDEGDTIIAVIMFNSSSAPLGSMQIQFLTTGKVENSLSVGYDDSGYTEAGSLTGDSNGITMTGLYKLDTLPTATVATDDKVIIQDTNDSDKIKTVTAQAIANLAGDGDSIEDADADTKIQVEESSDEDKIRFDTAGTERMIIDETGKVGIGTSSPDVDLDVKKSTTTIARVASTGSHANLRFGRANSSYDAAMLFYDDMATTPSLQWRIQMTNGGTDLSIRDEDGSPDGQEIMKFKDGGGIDINCDVDIASGHDLTVDTNTLHVDAANNRVGIGTTTPSQELDVSGDIRLSGEIEINGNLNHDGSNVGFYGTTPASRQSVGNLAATNISPITPTNPTAAQGFEPSNEAYLLGLENDIGDLRTKLDALIDALQLIGLIT